jgi:hypothetical protein
MAREEERHVTNIGLDTTLWFTSSSAELEPCGESRRMIWFLGLDGVGKMTID